MREAGEQPQDRRDGGGRARDHVGHDAVEGDLGREEHDDRPADELSGERDGDAQGQGAGDPPPEAARERLGEQQECARRGGGEQEAKGGREPGIRGDERRHREGEHRRARAAPTEQEREHGDRAHRGGADHTRLRRDEHDEAGEDDPRDGDARATPQPAQGAPGVGEADDEGTVAAGYRRQVR